MKKQAVNHSGRWSLEYWSQILLSTACFLFLLNGCSEIMTTQKINAFKSCSVEKVANSLVVDNIHSNGWHKIGLGMASFAALFRLQALSKRE